MTLRGEIEAFPLETVVQLIHSTSKTGQLEVRANDSTGGTLGFDGGRLVAAVSGDDVGEPALGAVFAVSQGSFEFIPWTDAPAANLTGDLDQLLDKAVEERDRIVAIRGVIPNDRSRFRLSERAADKGNITLSSDQWRTLLAVNGDRDVSGVADHLKAGLLVTRASLAALVEAGFIDVLEPAEAAAPPPPVVQAAPPPPAPAPEPPQWTPPAREWAAPAAAAPEPEPAPPPAATSWEPAAPPAQSWERPAPVEAPAQPQWSAPATDIRDDLAAALDARLGGLSSPPAAAPELAPAPPPPVEAAPPPVDDRLAALSGVFAPPQPEAPTAPVRSQDRISEWSRPAPAEPGEEVDEKKKKGPFGFLKRDDQTAAADAVAVAPAPAAAPGRAGQVASLANALLGEYNSGRYGKGRLDDRMANLLMRVDEQADPIDRPLPIVDDRIDSQALDRENVPEEQAIPYLALLVTQIYDDAARTFGKDKAKKGYKAAQQQVFGADASVLGADVAGRLPKV
jgi:hypothetical protein